MMCVGAFIGLYVIKIVLHSGQKQKPVHTMLFTRVHCVYMQLGLNIYNSQQKLVYAQ